MFESVATQGTPFLAEAGGGGRLRATDRSADIDRTRILAWLRSTLALGPVQPDVPRRRRSVVTRVGEGVWSLDAAAAQAAHVHVVTTGGAPESLSREQAADALVSVAKATSELEALRMRLLARAAGTVAEVRAIVVAETRLAEHPDGRVVARAATDALQVRDEIVDEIAARLNVSPIAMGLQVKRARLLTGPLGETCAALAVGAITAQHASVIADQAARMLPDVATVVAGLPQSDDPAVIANARLADETFVAKCAVLQDRVLPHARCETPGKSRSRCVRVIASIDAACERERRQRAKAQIGVFARPLDDGLAELVAVLPAQQAAVVLAAVDAHTKENADRLLPDEPRAALGQLRAAAYLNLLGLHAMGGFVGPCGDGGVVDDCRLGRPQVRAEIQVLVDAATLAGITPDLPAWARAGSGEPVGIDRDALIGLISDPTMPAVFRRLVCDPASGALVDRGAQTYAPNDDLVAWLIARDQTCRFPGCSRRAQRGDVDHATNFGDGGPTVLANTGVLCRRHHNRKTHGGWQILDSEPDGRCTFVSPHGHRFEHEPTRLLPEPPMREPAAPHVAGQRGDPTDDPPF